MDGSGEICTSDVLTASNDIYFNASASVDGSGTQDNPYKYLYANRLTSGCTAYFADGSYELDGKKRIIFLNESCRTKC